MINEKFYALSEEKQLKIINAALEVFAKNDYRHAITDDIASKAEISKGLLFHYFKDKKTLYAYLFNYVEEITVASIMQKDIQEIDDFFDMLEYGATSKSKMLSKNPYIMDFAVRAFYSEDLNINRSVQDKIDSGFAQYFQHINFSKFKDGIDPKQLFLMLTWMTEGYIVDMRRRNCIISPEQIMQDFHVWANMFKQIAYKEEYL